MTDQTRPALRIEIAIPERLESLFYTFFDRGIPALVRIADALERLPVAPIASLQGNCDALVKDLDIARQPSLPADAPARAGTTANVIKFTPERTAHLQANWRAADTREKKEALLAEINAMPGEPIPNVASMMGKVYNECWHKEPAPAVQPTVAPAAPARPAVSPPRKPSPEVLARIEARKAKLKEMFERGDDAKEIMVVLNSMWSPLLTERDVITRAAAFGFKRPAPLPPEAFTKGGPATIAEIKTWFTEAGGNANVIPTDERLVKAANALRAALKQPLFEVRA
jgi:hypothetical protein